MQSDRAAHDAVPLSLRRLQRSSLCSAVHDQGLRAIQWDVSTGDPTPQQSAAAIARAMLSRDASRLDHRQPRQRARLAHGGTRSRSRIPKLRKMGFEFVTVSELLAAGEPVVATDCYDSRPGDTDRYDRLAKRPRPLLRRPDASNEHAGQRSRPRATSCLAQRRQR